jgi:hypothetical protein
LNIASDGWHEAWVLRLMAGPMLIFAPEGGVVLKKELKAESEQVMEHHLRREELKELFKQELLA